MRFLSLSAALAAALMLAACADRHAGEAASLEDQIFLSAALAHTQSELELAQLAEQKAETPAVVAFAKRVAEHRAPLRDQLAELARASGTVADTQHTPDPTRFQELSGEAFERAYVASQIEDQQNAMDDFAFAAARPHDTALQQLAAAALPQFKDDLAAALKVVYDIPFAPEAEQDMGAGLAGQRH